MAVAILNPFYVVFGPLSAPHTKFHPNWMKNTVGENFCYWSVLVSRAGRPKKMVMATSNSFYVVFGPLLAPITNFIQIG